MAITLTKVPDELYPAYNDSYIQFTSSLSGNNRAEIVVLPPTLFPDRFIIYPNYEGVYTFNYKELVGARLAEYGLKDNQGATIGLNDWGQSLLGINIKLNSTIYVYNPFEVEDTPLTNNLTFYRGAKQVGEQVYNNNAQILAPSINGIDYDLTYFEGYPFSFELQKLEHSGSQEITVKNLNSNLYTPQIKTQFTGALKIIIDKGDLNWTNTDYLPLNDNLNRLEIYEKQVFKTNLNLKKVPNKCGVYLKWLNTDGGYSYWLFDEFYKSTVTARSRGTIGTNEFNNVGEFGSNYTSIGFDGTEVKQLKTLADDKEAKILKSLATSPMVQLYTSENPYIIGQFIDVKVVSNYTTSNKKSLNEIRVSVELPEMITPNI